MPSHSISVLNHSMPFLCLTIQSNATTNQFTSIPMLFLSDPYHSSAERHKATLNHCNSLLCFSVSSSLRHSTKQINADAFLFSALPSPLLSLRCYAISTRILSVPHHSHAMQLIANPFRITSGLRNSFSLRHMALLHLTLPALCISVLIFAHAEPVRTLPLPFKSIPHLAITVRFSACLCYGLTFRLLTMLLQCRTLPLLTLPKRSISTPFITKAQQVFSELHPSFPLLCGITQ